MFIANPIVRALCIRSNVQPLRLFQLNSTTSRKFSINHKLRSNSSTDSKNEQVSWVVTKPSKNVAHLELSRPKVKNAFSLETGQQLINALDDFDQDKDVRCVVLSGSGPDLTSGVDIKTFMGFYAKLQTIEDAGRKAKMILSIVEGFQQPFKRLHNFSKPIICVFHGHSLGLAMELGACSDIRYCSKDAKLAVREVLIGLAADVGSLQELPRLVSNQSLVRELIYTGREILPDEALSLGFVSKVCETKQETIEAAFETAKLIAKRSPVAVQGTKRNLIFSRDKPFNVGLDYNAIWNMTMIQSEDVARAIGGVLERTEDVEFEPY